MRRVLEGIDAAERAGLAPVKVNIVVQSRRQRPRRRRRLARHFRGQRPHPALHRVHGRGPHATAGGWTTSSPAARCVARIVRGCPLDAARRRTIRRGGAALALRRWLRRDRRHHLGDAALLRRLQRARDCRPTASCSPASLPRTASTCARRSATAQRRRDRGADAPRLVARAPTATRSSARRRRPASRRSRCPTSAAERGDRMRRVGLVVAVAGLVACAVLAWGGPDRAEVAKKEFEGKKRQVLWEAGQRHLELRRVVPRRGPRAAGHGGVPAGRRGQRGEELPRRAEARD